MSYYVIQFCFGMQAGNWLFSSSGRARLATQKKSAHICSERLVLYITKINVSSKIGLPSGTQGYIL